MDWSNTLVATVLTGLQNLNKPFKYAGMSFCFFYIQNRQDSLKFHLSAVTCMIMQKTGAGMATAASCYWDPALDGRLQAKVILCRMTASNEHQYRILHSLMGK
jgi:dynein light chain Tctex-type 1